MKVHTFHSLLRLRGGCAHSCGLSLEQPVRKIMNRLPRTRGRYPAKLRAGGKCDLWLWDDKGEENPLAAIEVKPLMNHYHTDVERLARLVQRNLEFGVFASCQVQQVKDKCKDVEDALIGEASSLCEGIKKHLNRVDGSLYVTWNLGNIEELQLEGDEQTLVWCPICLLICHQKDFR